MFGVQNQSVMVTGTASGLGYAMAECGAVVTLSDIDENGLARATEQLECRGLRVRSFVADVADPSSVRLLASMTVSEVGGLDTVFDNAGISAGPNPIIPLEGDLWPLWRLLRPRPRWPYCTPPHRLQHHRLPSAGHRGRRNSVHLELQRFGGSPSLSVQLDCTERRV